MLIFSGTTTGLEEAVGAGGDTGVTITDEPVISVGVVTGYEVQLNRNEQGVWSCKHTLIKIRAPKESMES